MSFWEGDICVDMEKNKTGKKWFGVRPQDRKGKNFSGLYCESTYLEVTVDHAHLVAVEHSF